MYTSRLKKIRRTLSGYLAFIALASSIFLTVSGCDDDNSGDSAASLPVGIMMADYFPLNSGSYWSYNWQNVRGDAWRGSMAVRAMRQDQGLNIFIVTDTTETISAVEVFTSAYLWDAEGFKHLYRIASNGDSIAFTPPRIVLLTKIDGGTTYRQRYSYEVYNFERKLKYTIDVNQKQKLIKAGAVEIGESGWNDCLAIETEWINHYSDGMQQMKRKIVWYARDVGPVKIISGIPLASTTADGEATGELAVIRN